MTSNLVAQSGIVSFYNEGFSNSWQHSSISSDAIYTHGLSQGFNYQNGFYAPFNPQGVITSTDETIGISISAFPNPTADFAQVSSDKEGDYFYQLYNEFGSLIQSGNFNSKLLLELQNYPSGQYILNVQGDTIWSTKIIKL
jgi:hypothetical protein